MKDSSYIIIILLCIFCFFFVLNHDAKIANDKRQEDFRRGQQKDYQVLISNDSIYVFDNNREVGQAEWDESPISLLFLTDTKHSVHHGP